MFSGLRPYAAYQEVGLPWLQHVPASWSVLRAKSVLRPADIRSAAGKEELLTVSSRRGVVRRSTADVAMFQAATYADHKLCWPGDLVINSLWAWASGLGVSPLHGIISTAYGVYRPNSLHVIDASYLHELVRSAPFQWELQVRSRGVWKSRLQLTDASFLDAPLPVPPLGEQEKIVKYLAHAHRRIDRAIDAKRRLIALLEEQKQAVINRAVTRGLDIDVPMSDSGSDWVGRHPRTWRVVRLKAVIPRISQGWSPQCDAQRPSVNEWGVLKAGCVNYGVFRPEESKRLASHLAPRPELQVKQGDILMSRANTLALVGSVAVVGREPARTMLSDKIYRFRVKSGDVNPEFLVKALASSQSRAQIQSAASGASFSMQNISQDVVRNMAIALPPIDEQVRIVDAIALETATTDSSIARALREIELLEEFRTRLTADVVTGQVDVREITASLPEIDPAELADDVTGADDEDLSDEAVDYLEDVTA